MKESCEFRQLFVLAVNVNRFLLTNLNVLIVCRASWLHDFLETADDNGAQHGNPTTEYGLELTLENPHCHQTSGLSPRPRSRVAHLVHRRA